MGIKERLNLVIKHLGISGRAFSKQCGFSESYYATINEGIGADKLNKILSNYPEISARWLVTGEGEMMAENDSFNQTKIDMMQENFFDALKRRDQQIDELLEQNSRLISVIESMTGTDFKQSQAG